MRYTGRSDVNDPMSTGCHLRRAALARVGWALHLSFGGKGRGSRCMAKLGLKQILTAAYALLATGLLGVPLLVEAQQVGKTYRVGYISFPSLPTPYSKPFARAYVI